MKAKFVKGISKKTGNEWYAVEVTLVDGYSNVNGKYFPAIFGNYFPPLFGK